MGRMGARVRDARGQSTVEAAVALPVVFLLVLLLVQPGIVLYDRMVMQGRGGGGLPAARHQDRRFGRYGRQLRGVRAPSLGRSASS
mgnify:CR=1 FL=1